MWITQNIVAAGSKPLNILLSQELLKNCLHIASNSVDHETEALQLLDIIIDSNWNEFEDNEKNEIQEFIWKLFTKKHDEVLVLQLFCKSAALENSGESEAAQVLIMMVKNLRGIVLRETTDEHIFYLTVKLLMKVLQRDQQSVIKLVELIAQQNVRLSDLINEAATNPKFYPLVKELMHLTSILFTSQHPLVAQYFAFDPIENIRITKIFEF